MMKKTFTRDEVSQILKEFFPFVNPLYLPISTRGILLSKLFNNKEITFPVNQDLSNNEADLEKIEGKDDNIENSPQMFGDEKLSEFDEENMAAGKDSRNCMNTFLNRKRKKFGNIHDHLLMIGLLTHGKKNIDLVQQLWLDSKTPQEIRHRIKNLSCLKASENVVKKWKNLNDTLLTKQEFYIFLKGIQWFGVKKKWNVISRYFLPERSSEYLEE